MSMVSEFREFAVKGNVMDMAVGIIIGGAFGKVVSSLVSDVIMPPLGMLIGKVNFSELKLVVQKAADAVPATDTTAAVAAVQEVAISYGKFIQTVLDFLIVAFAIFMGVKAINKLKSAEVPPAPAGPTADQQLLSEIRDLLKAQQDKPQ